MCTKLFEKNILGGIEVTNRIVRSATQLGIDSLTSRISNDSLDIYKELAEGNIGLIITGMMEVTQRTLAPKISKIDKDSAIPGLKKLTDLIHSKNGKIIAQIVHLGSRVYIRQLRKPYGPSAVQDLATKITSREMTVKQIKKLIEDFGDAALRIKKSNFDGVQLHAAHDYILSKFLSPYYNRRTDDYGGTIENRSRIILEIYENIRKKCNEDFSVFIKMNCSDFFENEMGLTFDDSLIAAKYFAQTGFNAIEVSGGMVGGIHYTSRKNILKKEDEAYHAEYANRIANEVSIPVIVVGGLRSPAVMEDLLQNSKIAAISMCRPFINEPQIINRWLSGDTEKTRCISCNKCFNPRITGCVLNKK